MTLNHLAAPAFHQFEPLGSLPPHVTHERRLNLFCMPLHAGEELMERVQHIRRAAGRNGSEIRLNTAEFIQQHGFEKGGLAGETCIQRLFAHADFFCEIIHGNATEPVGEKVAPRRGDDPLADRRLLAR
jgi:hypothetical protein